MKVNIGFPVVRTDGRAVYGHVITKFSGMGRFTKLWGSAMRSESQRPRETWRPLSLFGSRFTSRAAKTENFSYCSRNQTETLATHATWPLTNLLIKLHSFGLSYDVISYSSSDSSELAL